MNDAAPQHLEPPSLVFNLELVTRRREGEVILAPPLLGLPEQVIHEALEGGLEILGDGLAFWGIRPLPPPQSLGAPHLVDGEEFHPLELVERGVVRRVDLVPPVHVPRAQEGVGVAAAEVLALVGARVRPEERIFGDIIRVARRPSRMVGGDAQIVETLRRRDDGILGIVYLVRRAVLLGGEVLLDLGADDADGMVRTDVQSPTDERGYVGGDVVAGVGREVPRWIGVLGRGGGRRRRRRRWRFVDGGGTEDRSKGPTGGGGGRVPAVRRAPRSTGGGGEGQREQGGGGGDLHGR